MSQTNPLSCPTPRGSEPLRPYGLIQLGGFSIGGIMDQRLCDRFLAMVDKADGGGCWVKGTGKGYASFRDDKGKDHVAHRFAWELWRGPIPDGLCVLHTCDNPPCVNPAHLFLGTHSDNMADMVAKGRHAHGQRAGAAKLTDDDIRAIRSSDDLGIDVAERYGIDPSHVGRIRSRKVWSHIPGDSVIRLGKVRGERHGCAKLTEVDVLLIRASDESHVALARFYGVTPGAIQRVRNRKTWKYLT